MLVCAKLPISPQYCNAACLELPSRLLSWGRDTEALDLAILDLEAIRSAVVDVGPLGFRAAPLRPAAEADERQSICCSSGAQARVERCACKHPLVLTKNFLAAGFLSQKPVVHIGEWLDPGRCRAGVSFGLESLGGHSVLQDIGPDLGVAIRVTVETTAAQASFLDGRLAKEGFECLHVDLISDMEGLAAVCADAVLEAGICFLRTFKKLGLDAELVQRI